MSPIGFWWREEEGRKGGGFKVMDFRIVLRDFPELPVKVLDTCWE
uniref:Uncharacterized protein n=1 Tax=Zea mays TaxID=4577 RepID=B6SMC2_MAIZE|nr:hypothetical protein [Zea mays]